MEKKSRKTLYMPDLVINILEFEAEVYGGPGVVVAAAILDFSRRPTKEKKKILSFFRNFEIDGAYQNDSVAVKLAEEQQHKNHQQKPKATG